MPVTPIPVASVAYGNVGWTAGELIKKVRAALPAAVRELNPAVLGPQGFTLTQHLQRVRDVLRDDDADFIDDTRITEWLNEAYFELASRTRLIRTITNGNLTDTGTVGTFAVPTDFLSTIVLEVAGQRAEPVTDVEWYDWIGAPAGTDPPRPIYRIVDTDFELLPRPVLTVSYRLIYAQRPAALVAGIDKPTAPTALQTKAINYARGHGLLKEGMTAQAQMYLGLFEQGLPPSVELENAQGPLGDADQGPQGPVRVLSDDDVLELLNEAIIDISEREGGYEYELNDFTDGTDSIDVYDLVPDLTKPVELRLNSEAPFDDATFVDGETFRSWQAAGTSFPPHTIAHLYGGRIELVPQPDANTAFRFRYWAAASLLEDAADVPRLTPELQMKMVAYARGHACLRMGLVQDSERYMAEYLHGLHTPQRAKRRIGGPIQLAPPMGVFDRDDGARHLG